MKKRHVIFDFDGTITDSFGPCSKDLMATAQRLGLPADEQVLALMAENYGLPTVELLNICWPRQKHEAFEQSILDANAKGHTPLFPGAENMLLELDRAGIGMSIFTGRQRSGVLPVLKAFGIDKFFSQVVTRDDVALGKPDPEGLNKIIGPLLANGMSGHSFRRRQQSRLCVRRKRRRRFRRRDRSGECHARTVHRARRAGRKYFKFFARPAELAGNIKNKPARAACRRRAGADP